MKPWRFSILGVAELVDAEGTKRTIPYRQVGLLLLLLSREREKSFDRDHLAATLWPDSDRISGRNSLKQALAALRRMIGEENLQATRFGCRLDPGFELIVDIDHKRDSAQAVDPDYDVDWISQAREESLAEDDTPAKHFYHFVHYLGVNDPNRALATMRDNLTLVRTLAPQRFNDLQILVMEATELPGWKHYFSAYAVTDTLTSNRSRLGYEAALEDAHRTRDLALGVQASVQIALIEGRRGNPEAGKKYGQIALDWAMKSRDSNVRSSAYQALGVATSLAGDPKASNEFFSRAVDGYSNRLDAYVIQSIQFYHLASLGIHPDLRAALPNPLAVAKQSGHRMLEFFAASNRVLLHSLDYSPAQAAEALQNGVDLADEIGLGFYQILSREALRRGLRRAGLPTSELEEELTRMRREQGLRHCIWDLAKG